MSAQTAVLDRSLAQRRAALEHANEIRMGRARLKARLKAGQESVPAILAAPPEAVLTMTVRDLLFAQPMWGHVKVNKVLAESSISLAKTVGALSTRQRVELIDELRRRGQQ